MLGARNIAVLDWVPMNVIEVVSQVSLVTNNVIPKTSLPETQRGRYVVCFLVVEREVTLDAVYDSGEISLLIFHPHEPVKVVWKHNIGQ